MRDPERRARNISTSTASDEIKELSRAVVDLAKMVKDLEQEVTRLKQLIRA